MHFAFFSYNSLNPIKRGLITFRHRFGWNSAGTAEWDQFGDPHRAANQGNSWETPVKSCSGLRTKMNIFPNFICFYSPGHEKTIQKRSQGGPLPLSSAGLQKLAAFWGLAAPRPGGWLSNSGNETGPSGTARDSAPRQRSAVVKNQGEKWEKVKTNISQE